MPYIECEDTMSDDDSPILKRGGRRRQNRPVIQESQNTPSQVEPKLPVPPSPGIPTSQHQDASRWEQARRISRRQQMLDHPFIAHQAVEGNEGSSVEGSGNSEDNQ